MQKLGVLDLLDEESRFPKGTDQSLLEKLHNAHKANAFYVKPKVNNAKFGIRHYAGEVFYDVNGLLEKNRDTFRDDVLKVLKESRYVYVSTVGGSKVLKYVCKVKLFSVRSEWRAGMCVS